MLSNTAKKAIDHAQHTTGTLQWCSVGVFSGDGKRALDSIRLRPGPSDDVARFLEKRCSRFTGPEILAASHRQMQRSLRYRALAKKAIDLGKFDAAVSLVESAKDALRQAEEISSGKCVLYHLPNSRVEEVAR